MKKTRFVYYFENSFLPRPVPMYRNAQGSDISDEELNKRGLPIPLTPTFKTWVNKISNKQRCARCYAALRGTWSDLNDHFDKVHKLQSVML